MQQRNPRSAAADGHSKTYQDIICRNRSSRSTGCFKHHPYHPHGTGGLGKSSVNGLNHCIPCSRKFFTLISVFGIFTEARSLLDFLFHS